MANNLKMNIKMFSAEGGFLPNAWESMVNQYDQELPNVNRTFMDHQDVLEIFRNVAGSPKLTEITKEHVVALNNAIEETANYFDSVRNWSTGVTDAVQSVLGTSISGINNALDRTVLNQINDNYNAGFVGVEHFSDVSEYITGVQNVISQLRSGLSAITDAVASADNSLPDQVHNALSSRIQTNNDSVLEGYDLFSRYLSENLDAFSQQLQGAINDLSNAANGAGA